jgi:hypothetical protein
LDIADSIGILDYLKPEERPAWLDRLARRDYRYVLKEKGEREAEPSPKRRQANIARLREMLGPGFDANFVYFDPPERSRRGVLIHLKDGSPLTLEILARRDQSFRPGCRRRSRFNSVFSHSSSGLP